VEKKITGCCAPYEPLKLKDVLDSQVKNVDSVEFEYCVETLNTAILFYHKGKI
jgi:hypothetical protein